jgi:acyl-homoserine lactone acylase PvdQ
VASFPALGLRHPKSIFCRRSVGEGLPVNGSNDWVVSGAHTVTGKPLLSDDMHLGHTMPNLWYEAHLHSGALEVAGVTLPGVPYVIVGHNQRIAWGFTNVGPTVTDVYIENFNAQGAYQTPSGWVQPEHRMRGHSRQGQAGCECRCEDHAPRTGDHRNVVPGETRPLALRWTLYDVLQDVRCSTCRLARRTGMSFRKAFAHVRRSRGRMWSTPTSMEISDIRRPAKFQFAPRETAACR